MKLLNEAASIILDTKPGVGLTGAGISVDSGIPHFRGDSGLWEKYDPEEYVSIAGFMRNPAKVWELYKDLGNLLLNSEPNPGHTALAVMEQEGLLNGVITQNIDGLHLKAGSSRIVEYHGSSDRVICMTCKKNLRLTEEVLAEVPPECDKCNKILKPDIVFFGEMIPKQAVYESVELVDEAGFVIVVGTSSTVYPANQIPIMMKGKGGKVIEVNLEETPLSAVADVTLLGSSSDILPKLLDHVRKANN